MRSGGITAGNSAAGSVGITRVAFANCSCNLEALATCRRRSDRFMRDMASASLRDSENGSRSPEALVLAAAMPRC